MVRHACRNTPTTLTLAGIALLVVAGVTVVFVPDESVGLVAAQTAAALALCGVAGTALLHLLALPLFQLALCLLCTAAVRVWDAQRLSTLYCTVVQRFLSRLLYCWRVSCLSSAQSRMQRHMSDTLFFIVRSVALLKASSLWSSMLLLFNSARLASVSLCNTLCYNDTW